MQNLFSWMILKSVFNLHLILAIYVILSRLSSSRWYTHFRYYPEFGVVFTSFVNDGVISLILLLELSDRVTTLVNIDGDLNIICVNAGFLFYPYFLALKLQLSCWMQNLFSWMIWDQLLPFSLPSDFSDIFYAVQAMFKPPRAIRGGIPLCFPQVCASFFPYDIIFCFSISRHLTSWCYMVQFSNFGPLEAHGFARNRVWIVDPEPPPLPTSSPNKASVDLLLKPSEDDLKIWSHRYRSPSSVYMNVWNLVQTIRFTSDLCS